MQRALRLKRELMMLSTQPPPGISCWQDEGQTSTLKAQIVGSEGTPYCGGIFLVELSVPERYPFEPPKVNFITPIYHPNIDGSGRICLDTLKMPPQGAWKPSVNIATLLSTIRLLMAEPNADDPLMADISAEYKFDRLAFTRKAKEWTARHAMTKSNSSTAASNSAACAAKSALACSERVSSASSKRSSTNEGFSARKKLKIV